MTAALAALESLLWKNQCTNQVGLALLNLTSCSATQTSLFEDPRKGDAEEALQRATDTLHKRFGRDAVTHGSALPVESGVKKNLEFPIVG
jgi:hypothetical protein